VSRLIRYLEDGVWKYASVKDIGDLSRLQTLNNDDIVSAINELVQTSGVDMDKRMDEVEARTVALDEDITDAMNNIVYKVEIISSNGNVFKNGAFSTILEAKVYRGAIDVTDTMDASRFRWKRISSDIDGDNSWNTSHFGGAKQITITPADIYVRATFNCEILDL